MRGRRALIAMTAAEAATLLATTVVTPVGAATVKARAYRSCTELHRGYPHGVARSDARDRTTSGRPVTTFRVSTAVYRLNDGAPDEDLDRDNDGVACEQR